VADSPRNESVGVEAARRVTVEVLTLLGEFRDSITLVGGSTPPLLVGERRNDPYAGTLDVDLLIDPLEIPDDVYRAMGELLAGRGYIRGAQPYQWLRTVTVGNQEVEVRLDLLAPPTDRRGRSRRHELIEDDLLARRLVGGELVRRSFEEREMSGQMPDGRRNRVNVRIAAAASFIVLKALALAGRDKPKDAYDIDYVLAYVEGGPDRVAEDLAKLGDAEPIAQALETLAQKFDSSDGYGPGGVAVERGLSLGSRDAAEVQALAYARVARLLRRYNEIRSGSDSQTGFGSRGGSREAPG